MPRLRAVVWSVLILLIALALCSSTSMASPDLTVDNLSFSPPIDPNAPYLADQTVVTIYIHVSNIGTTAAAGRVGIRLMLNQGVAREMAFNDMQPGESRHQLMFQGTLQQGEYAAIGDVDQWNDQVESNEANNSIWRLFNVINPQDTSPPPVPTLLSPLNGAAITDDMPTLDWDNVYDPEHNGEKYDAQVSTDPGFSTVVRSDSDELGTAWTVSPALAPGTYFWRVRSKDYTPNISAWSAPFSFSLQGGGTATGCQLSDGFASGLSLWGAFGTPPPTIDGANGNPAPCLQVNGDGWYDSGLYLLQSLDVWNGASIRFDLEPSGSFGRPYTDAGVGYGTGSGSGSGNWVAYIRHRWDQQGQFSLYFENQEYQTSYRVTTQRWIPCKILIRPDHYIEYYIDNQLQWTSPGPIANSNNHQSVFVQGERYLVDNVCVSGMRTLVLTPNTADVYVGDQLQFQATAFGVANSNVIWSVAGGPPNGTISPSGLYTAPAVVPAIPEVTIQAISQADPTLIATANIRVLPHVLTLFADQDDGQSVIWGQSPGWRLTVTNDVGNPVAGASIFVDESLCHSTDLFAGVSGPDGTFTYTTPCSVPDGTPSGEQQVAFRAEKAGWTSGSTSRRFTVFASRVPPIELTFDNVPAELACWSSWLEQGMCFTIVPENYAPDCPPWLSIDHNEGALYVSGAYLDIGLGPWSGQVEGVEVTGSEVRASLTDGVGEGGFALAREGTVRILATGHSVTTLVLSDTNHEGFNVTDIHVYLSAAPTPVMGMCRIPPLSVSAGSTLIVNLRDYLPNAPASLYWEAYFGGFTGADAVKQLRNARNSRRSSSTSGEVWAADSVRGDGVLRIPVPPEIIGQAYLLLAAGGHWPIDYDQHPVYAVALVAVTSGVILSDIPPQTLRNYETHEIDLTPFLSGTSEVPTWSCEPSVYVDAAVFGGHFLRLAAPIGYSGTETVRIRADGAWGSPLTGSVAVTCDATQLPPLGDLSWKEPRERDGSVKVLLDRASYQGANADEVWQAVADACRSWTEVRKIQGISSVPLIAVSFVSGLTIPDVIISFSIYYPCNDFARYGAPDPSQCNGAEYGAQDKCPLGTKVIHLNAGYAWNAEPIAGVLDDYYYSCSMYDAADAYSVTLHEFGHALGLGHTTLANGDRTSRPTMVDNLPCNIYGSQCAAGIERGVDHTLSATDRRAVDLLLGDMLVATARSPVDLALIAPSGRRIDRDSVPGMRDAGYFEGPLSDTYGDAHVDQLWLLQPEPGAYRLLVEPDGTAGPGDSVSVAVVRNGESVLVVPRMPVEDLPRTGYVFALEVPVTVKLASFSAALSGENSDDVRLLWTTTFEQSHSGFGVYRRAIGEAWDEISTGLVTGGPDYEFRDHSIEFGMRYEYEVESVSRSGERERFGPVAIEVPAITRVSLRAAPNPARSGTTVYLSLPGQCGVAVKVHDLAGRVVRSLFAGPASAGHHEITWDGKDEVGREAPSGIYYVRVVVPDEIRAIRVTLTR